MALIDCPECHSKTSSKALACPHCGYRETSSFTFTWFFAVILVLLGFLVIGSNSIEGILLWILAAILLK